MIPLDDWMEMELYLPQAAKLDIQLVMPDIVDPMQDESAVFEVKRIGPEVKDVKVGDVVVLYGVGAASKIKLPNGRKTVVGQSKYVCFIMEKEDLVKA